MYGLVCDRASCNLSLLKHLCGTAGQYGIGEDKEVTNIPCSFLNPCSGHSVHLIICPSHQVRHLGVINFVVLIQSISFVAQ